MVAYIWAITAVAWNKLQHILHGNGSMKWLAAQGADQREALDRTAGLFGRMRLWTEDEENFCEAQIVHLVIGPSGARESFVLAVPHAAHRSADFTLVPGTVPWAAEDEAALQLSVAFLTPDESGLAQLRDYCPADSVSIPFHETGSPDPCALSLAAPTLTPFSNRTLALSYVVTFTVARGFRRRLRTTSPLMRWVSVGEPAAPAGGRRSCLLD